MSGVSNASSFRSSSDPPAVASRSSSARSRLFCPARYSLCADDNRAVSSLTFVSFSSLESRSATSSSDSATLSLANASDATASSWSVRRCLSHLSSSSATRRAPSPSARSLARSSSCDWSTKSPSVAVNRRLASSSRTRKPSFSATNVAFCALTLSSSNLSAASLCASCLVRDGSNALRSRVRSLAVAAVDGRRRSPRRR
mmetsp:Transcript_545/g.2241  ORF Transcript_545/g.2241 Transcript_545/m.2241 type:complete len:200 (-) Transcript_545:490-1089(-)